MSPMMIEIWVFEVVKYLGRFPVLDRTMRKGFRDLRMRGISVCCGGSSLVFFEIGGLFRWRRESLR